MQHETKVSLILKEANALPPRFQDEVLHYIGYLKTRVLKNAEQNELEEWSLMSLKNSIEGMENDSWPNYDEKDLKEKL